MENAQKYDKKTFKTHKNAETQKKLLTNKNAYDTMRKVAEGTTRTKRLGST